MREVAAILVCVVVMSAGCSQPPALDLVPVTGKVTLNGKAVAPGSIVLQSDRENALPTTSLLQLDGSFTMRTYPHGDGARPGTYRAYLQLGGGTTPETAPFTKPETTPLVIEVPAAGLTNYHIELAEVKAPASSKEKAGAAAPAAKEM